MGARFRRKSNSPQDPRTKKANKHPNIGETNVFHENRFWFSGAPPLGAQEMLPEWVSNCVYLLLAVLQEYIYSTSCLSLLLTRDLFGSCPGLLCVVERGEGALGGSLGAQAVSETPVLLMTLEPTIGVHTDLPALY